MDEHTSQDAFRTDGAAASPGEPANRSRPSPPDPAFDPRDLVPEPLFCCDADGRLVWMNGAAEQLTGQAASALVGQPYPVLFPPDERRRRMCELARLARGAGDFYYEAKFVTGAGRNHWVGLKVKRIQAPAGAFGYVASVHDLQGIHQQLEDLKRREKELQARLDEATAASQLKTDFLAAMSHEIRNPMNGVIGMSRMLADSNLDRDQRTWTDVILQSGQALLQLVNDILDFSKIEAGRLDLESIDFDLRVAMSQCAALLQPRAAEKQLVFSSAVSHKVPSRLVGDPGRVRQVLLNLAGNAIKFTEKGSVEIRAELAEETAHQVVLRFSVHDTGVGIAQEQVDRVFEAFVQGDASVVRRYGGSGFGLSITRRLVSCMGGEVGFSSELGKGSTFWFMLPLKKQPEDAQPVTLPEVDLQGCRVLVVDPSPAIRAGLVEMLQAWGCVSDEAEDGLQALDRLRAAAGRGLAFHIVIVDMDLPVLDPESFAAAIRAEKSLCDPALMLLTNLGRRGDAAHAQDWGYAAYLLKPVQVSHFHEALLHVMGGHRMVSVPPGSKVSTTPKLITRHTIAEQQRQRLRVLIVEDNPVNQLVAVAALRRVGYAPEVAATGQAALDAAGAGTFDMIFMDVMLDDVDGCEVTRRIRASEHGRRTPIVAMTAHVRPEEKLRCFESGMDDYLSKPIDLEQMCRLVEHWAGRADAAVDAPRTRDANDEALADAAIGTFLEAPAEESAAAARTAEAPAAVEAPPAPWTEVPVAETAPAVPAEVEVTTWEVEAPAEPAAPIEAAAETPWSVMPAEAAWPAPEPVAANDAPAPEAFEGSAPASGLQLVSLDSTIEAAPDSEGAEPAGAAHATFKPQSWDEAKDAGIVESPVLDRARLELSTMGEPELERVLVHTFLTQIGPRVQRLHELVGQGNAELLEREAHGLKGMCATLGAVRCAEVFEHLERLGREKRLEPAAYKLQRAETEVQRVQELLAHDRPQAA